MKRILAAVAALVMLVVVVPSQAHAGAVGPQSVGGSGTSVVGEKFSISVKTNADGKLSGSAKYEYPAQNIRVAGHATCLYVSGNTGTMVIAVESGSSPTG